jgi:hypothetical protein
VIVAFETLDNVTGVIFPFINLSICCHGMSQMGTTILDGNCVTVSMEPAFC